MAIKTFWRIVIKIIGIYLLFGSSISVFRAISLVVDAWVNLRAGERLEQLLVLAFMIIVLYIILVFFVWKPDWLVNKLRLPNGFEDETLNIAASQTVLLKIAVMVVSGFIFADSLLILLSDSVWLFWKFSSFPSELKRQFPLYIFVKTCVAYLVMIKSSQNCGFSK